MRVAKFAVGERRTALGRRASERLAVNRQMGVETARLSACFDVQVLVASVC